MRVRTILVVTLPCVCSGLATSNPFLNLLSGLPGIGNKDTDAPLVKTPEDGTRLLQQLDLTSSTTPVLAGARPESVPLLIAASIPAVTRLGSGVFALDYKLSVAPKDSSTYAYLSFFDKYQTQETCYSNIPDLPIVMYETEGCPYCRAVREACSILSLTVTYRPTPRKGRLYAKDIKKQYNGRLPVLKDPNTGRESSDWKEIIEYLFGKYGNHHAVPWTLQNDSLVIATACLGLALAGGSSAARLSVPPELPLVLWAYEGSPFCKRVRTTLTTLELEHTVIYTPRGSPNRQALFEKEQRVQVPWLEDPNTGVRMFESEAICEYLEKMYARTVNIQYM
jgi:glutathione S-transferase